MVSFLRSAGQLPTSNESSAPAGESYEGSHDGGGVAQSLDGGVGPLLEVVVVAGHVEGGEGRPAALHGSGQRGGRQGHGQPAVGGQRALDGVGQGGRPGAHRRGQRLWMLEARESRSGGDPGAEREVVRGGEGGGCGVGGGRQVHVTVETKTTSATELSWDNLGKSG